MPRHDSRPRVHVLHIGKTGGTAVNYTLLEHEAASRFRLLFRGHRATLADVPVGDGVLFLLREPLSRFVSAFNGRLREDRPRYYYPWREEEREAFAVFHTPDELARALSADDTSLRIRAERAMRGIGHVNTPYSFWFGHQRAFRRRLSDVFFIGLQERLDEDFGALRRKLELPPDVRLPRDDEAAHRTPAGFDTTLSALGRRNLERWYAHDCAFYALCREIAPRINETDDSTYRLTA